MIVEILIVCGLILLNAVFAMSEMALVSARRPRLIERAAAGDRSAAAALRLAEDPTRFLSTVQIGITLVGVLAGAYSGATLAGPVADLLATVPALAPHARPIAVALVVAGVTFVSLVVGELVPKRLALANATTIAMLVARPMSVLATIATPAVWLLRISTDAILRLFRIDIASADAVTEDEIRAMVREGADSGAIERAEQSLINSVLALDDRPVRTVMTPRHEVIWLDADIPFADQLQKITGSARSRYPVARGSLDEPIGIAASREILDIVLAGGTPDPAALARPVLVVHEAVPLLKMIALLRDEREPMALVVDEYGGVEGVVTATDILSAIAGETALGWDDDRPSAVARPNGGWLADGRMAIGEIERLLDRDDLRGAGDYATLAGFLLWHMERVPAAGDVLDWQDIRFEVVDMDGRRIDKIMITNRPNDEVLPGGGI
ncbi:hemolysin family protein [Tistrella bauzanensis]|uniref:Hemolysin family protein n=1 Tax=Tistrella arctica TaxID=3133430 RepID=A0ABU9YHD3_9PROT